MSLPETPQPPAPGSNFLHDFSGPAWASRGPEAIKQLQLFFDHAPIGLSWRELDEHGALGRNVVNRRFCELVGLTPQEASSIENIRQITHPDDWTL